MAELNPATVETVLTTTIYAIEDAISTITNKWIARRSLWELRESLIYMRGLLTGIASEKTSSVELECLLKEINNPVYDASDLMDEILTVARSKQLFTKGGRRGKLCEMVRSVLSAKKSVIHDYKMRIEVEKIRKIFKTVTVNFGHVSLVGRLLGRYDSDGYQPPRRKEETAPFVVTGENIGRDEDVHRIVKMVLNKDVETNLQCLAVVGVGGLGKTTLAQLAYNHPRIKKEFHLKSWVYVGDDFNLMSILQNILVELTGRESEITSMDAIRAHLKEIIEGKRYFLVLDDVWNENREAWLILDYFLRSISGPGSMILVTTRSLKVANIVGTEPPYELQPLLPEHSMALFSRIAFGTKYGSSPDLIEIGEEIARSCSGVPLAIKVVAGLLYGHDEKRWKSFLHKGLANLGRSYNPIMDVLKASYDNLPSPIKACFIYLALFPRNYVIDKHMLIDLWMAQQYTIIEFEPQDTSRREIAEDCFVFLQDRSFFCDFQEDEYGEVVSCKIQNLMHDLAKGVAGREICETSADANNLSSEVRHLTHAGAIWEESSCPVAKIHSYLQTLSVHSPVTTVIASCRCLRALDLHGSDFEYLPDSIGKLLHLRYLNLSKNVNLKELPKSVTKLYNLQTLNLYGCYGLQELPEDLSNLVNLMNLYVNWDALSYMPPGMNELTSLYTLTSFVVADKSLSGKKCVGQLKDLSSLTHLQGHINISIPENFSSIEDDDRSTGVLQNMERLKAVSILFHGTSFEENQNSSINQETLLGTLHPHSNLKGLTLSGYQGMTMPMWGRHDNLARFLPNLIRIELRSCQGLQHLPQLGELMHLKSLLLHNLRNLEYIENTSSCSSLEGIFFPALEQLELVNLHKLKGWWSRVESVDDNSVDQSNSWQQPSFPCLSKLTVQSCYDLKVMPPCPSLETLSLRWYNDKLRIIVGNDHEGSPFTSSPYPSVVQCGKFDVKLKEVEIDNKGYLESSTRMLLDLDKELPNLSEDGEILSS